eukprot:915230-Pyramimonas_sp.AAC.1
MGYPVPLLRACIFRLPWSFTVQKVRCHFLRWQRLQGPPDMGRGRSPGRAHSRDERPPLERDFSMGKGTGKGWQ